MSKSHPGSSRRSPNAPLLGAFCRSSSVCYSGWSSRPYQGGCLSADPVRIQLFHIPADFKISLIQILWVSLCIWITTWNEKINGFLTTYIFVIYKAINDSIHHF